MLDYVKQGEYRRIVTRTPRGALRAGQILSSYRLRPELLTDYVVNFR
jgi:hypothetical protein